MYLIFQNQICLTDMYHATITGIYTRYQMKHKIGEKVADFKIIASIS